MKINPLPPSKEGWRKSTMAIKGTLEWKQNISKGRAGIVPNIPNRDQWRKNCGKGKMGEKNPSWRGGVTHPTKLARQSAAYREWRLSVFKRDKFTCIKCGDSRGGNLEADHIKPFSQFLDLRYEVSNGRTLCKICHRKTDTWGH